MGDGVNIAARLEGIAKPGAICLSEDAYRLVKSRLDLAVSDLGETQLKNIAEPIRVYSLEVGRPARVKQPSASTPPRLSRACALQHSSCLTLRLRFNLPQPGVSIIRAAPHPQSNLIAPWLRKVIQQTMVANARARPTSRQTRSNAVNTTPNP